MVEASACRPITPQVKLYEPFLHNVVYATQNDEKVALFRWRN